MLANKYIEPNRARAEVFLSTLQTAQESLDLWLHVQRAVGALKPVFVLGDIGKVIPKEAQAFVDAVCGWRGLVAGDQRVEGEKITEQNGDGEGKQGEGATEGKLGGSALSILGSQGTLDSLKSLSTSFHEVERGLQEYMAIKR